MFVKHALLVFDLQIYIQIIENLQVDLMSRFDSHSTFQRK
jgi:hypothetical protein